MQATFEKVRLGNRHLEEGVQALSSVAAAWKKLPWWVEPFTVAGVLIAFGIYSTAVIVFAGGQYEQYISPFFSFTATMDTPAWAPAFITAPMLLLWIPLGFRATCYYYRKAYYRAFFWDPPACQASAQTKEPRSAENYRGERALFVLNNVHRYFLYASFFVIAFLWYEAFRTVFTYDAGVQIAVGSLLWFANIILVSAYTFSCHSFRHLIGGNMNCYSCVKGGGARRKTYNFVSRLNAKHPQWAWYSLFSLLFTDIYLRLIAAGTIQDYVLISFGG
ncbi:hypothetical protein BH20ACT10_BH20ACT10_04780 [soil metagenome]